MKRDIEEIRRLLLETEKAEFKVFRSDDDKEAFQLALMMQRPSFFTILQTPMW